VPAHAPEQLSALRAVQRQVEDELVPIMTGLVQCTALMASPRAARSHKPELDTPVI